MPRQYPREKDSNNYKLLQIIAENGVENFEVQRTILKFWDVDKSEGTGLDRLGKDEGISRGGWDDKEYRKMIKIQCILNLSEGDLETMNQIMDAYMERDFVGFQEGWMEFEPATLLLNIRSSAKTVPDKLIKRIKTAGVGIIILLNELNEFIRLHVGTYGWLFNGRICGRFRTASRPGNADKLNPFRLSPAYVFPFDAPITGNFKTASRHGTIATSKVQINENGYSFATNKKRCGRFHAGGV